MFKILLSLFFIFFSNILFSQSVSDNKKIKLIFGSCSNQNKLMKHWQFINSYKPDYLILLGDNVYGDFNDKEARNLHNAYNKLNENNYYRRLKETVKIFPIWDDHDYGINDGGKDWIHKEKAKRLFLDFFNVKDNDKRRKRAGIYNSWEITNNIKIKVLALDTRYFKDKFKLNKNPNLKQKYLPDYNLKKTILGNTQWKWLSEQISGDYDLLLILSSIQVLPKNHGWEKWFNFPHERSKIINLIKDKGKTTIILSGDRHLGGVYKLNDKVYEITSSSFNQSILKSEESDELLIKKVVTENNFGFIQINTDDKILDIQLRNKFFKENKILRQIKIKY